MMKIQPRQYQADTVDAWYNDILIPGCNPLIALPTGSGKSVVLALLIQRYLKDHPHNEILILSHTKEILEQDYEALTHLIDEPIGLYSAGLNSKEHRQITVGGIQSVVKNKNLFKWANLVIVDEAHSVSHNQEGSYRSLLDDMHATIAGMSATIFRTGHGLLHTGKDRLFNKLSHDLTSASNFSKLVDDGYLSPLLAVAPKTQLDSSSVKKTGGEYNIKDLSATHDKDEITDAALDEAMYYGKNYKKWLTFAIDIDHANHITDKLNEKGIQSKVLHSKTTEDRSQIFQQFRDGEFRCLVTVGMATTGLDIPDIDLILILRPTMSAVLHVQLIGRGLRIADGKKHCLVLDYAGNTERLGPINDVTIPKKGKKGTGEAPVKKCPKCRGLNATVAKFCVVCGHGFVFEVKLAIEASKAEIVKKTDWKPESKEKWLKVTKVIYNIHRKAGKPDSILITYLCGITRVKEWILVEHPGWAGAQAKNKLNYRGYYGPLKTAVVFQNKHKLLVPKQILVDYSTKFPSINNAKF